MLKKKIGFQISHLKSLLESDDSCVSVVENFKGKLSLLPFHLGYLKHAVRELLDNQVSKYDPELNGIVLGHSNIKVINYLQHSDCCTFDLSYIADIYLFTPVVGKHLTGVINKKSKEHIGCLIHSAFNASIPKPRTKGEDLNVWLRTHGSVQIGSDLDFTVSKVDFSSRVPYISGTIVSKDTDYNDDGADSGVCCQDSVDEASTKSKKKKRKSKEDARLPRHDDHSQIDALSYHDPDQISQLLNPKLQPTKGKRKKSETTDTIDDHLSPPPVKKIKKEKRAKSPESEYDFPLPFVIKTDVDDSSLPVPLDKIKTERLSVSPPRLKSPEKRSKSKRNGSDKNATVNDIKREPTVEELTSSLLKEAIDNCFSPKHNVLSSSSESERKKKKKQINKSVDSEKLNFSTGSTTRIDGNSASKRDIVTGTSTDAEERKSKKRKRSESPLKSEQEDSFVKKSKKKKSRRSVDNLDEITNSLLAETLSHLK